MFNLEEGASKFIFCPLVSKLWKINLCLISKQRLWIMRLLLLVSDLGHKSGQNT